MSSSKLDFDLEHLARTLWRGRWIIAIATALAIGAGYFYATEMARQVYRASATVAIENRESNVTNFDSVVGGISADQPALNTEIHVIRSRQLLERLVDQEGLLADPEFNPSLAATDPYSPAWLREKIFGPAEARSYSDDELMRIAVDRVRQRLAVSNPRQSYVFEISFSAYTPQKAARLANAVADLYINDQLVFKEEQSARAIAFLTERTADLQLELGEAELAVKDFAASTDLVDPETLAAKNRQVKELRDRLDELDAQLSNLEARVDLFESLVPEDLTLEDAVSLNMPLVVRVFREAESGVAPAGRLESALAASLAQADTERTMLRQQRETLQQAIEDLEAQVDAQSHDLLALQQLQRVAEATGDIYTYFLTRLKETEVQQGTQQPDARLLSAAVLPRFLASPRLGLILALAAVFGAMLGAAFVVLRELFSNGVRSAEELTRMTELTVLGQIPLAPIRKRSALVDYIAKRETTAFSEAVRNLRTSVLLSTESGEHPKTILLTSSVPSEGKTTTSIALAHSLVGLNKSVLLVEADVRRLTLENYFGDIQGISLLDAVDRKESVFEGAAKVEKLGFTLLKGAESNVNAADFFSSPEFVSFLAKAREEFDYVVIDAPPCLPVADARIIGANVDAILFNCAWDSTRVEIIKSGLVELSAAGLTPTGLVLTKIDPAKARSYGGGTRYGTYYGSYAKGYYK